MLAASHQDINVIISNSKRYIFVHIHKTGGTSISQALDRGLDWNDIICGGSRNGDIMENYFRDRFGLHKHSRAAEIKSIVGDNLWNEYFTFAFVRNPYSRIVSLYTWLQKILRQQGLRRIVRRLDVANPIWAWPGIRALMDSPDFSSFIRHKEFIENAPGAKPMSDWLMSDDKLLVKYVGKVENMDEDFNRVCQLLGLEGVALTRTNVSRRKGSLADFYTCQEDYDHIYGLLEKDFTQFGYTKVQL